MLKVKMLVMHSSEGEECEKAACKIKNLMENKNFDVGLHSQINYLAIAKDAENELEKFIADKNVIDITFQFSIQGVIFLVVYEE